MGQAKQRIITSGFGSRLSCGLLAFQRGQDGEGMELVSKECEAVVVEIYLIEAQRARSVVLGQGKLVPQHLWEREGAQEI